MNKKEIIKLILLGIIAGIANGFLGSGGGIIMLIGLYAVIKDIKKAHASCIFAILPMSLVSAFVYFEKGNVDTGLMLPLLISAAAGGFLGAIFLSKLKPKIIEIIFAAIMIFSGVRCFL